MRTFLSFVSRMLASVFAILAVATIPIAALAFNVGGTLFSPATMKEISVEVVAEADFLSRFAVETMGKGNLGDGGGEEGVDEPALKTLFSYLDLSDWERLRRILLPEEVLAAYTESTLDGFYGWLDSDQPLPDIRLDVSRVKEKMTGPEREEIARILFESLPPCTAEEMEDIQADPTALSSPAEIFELTCKAPGIPAAEQIGVYELVLIRLAGEIPSEVDLSEGLGNGGGGEDLRNAKMILRVIRQVSELIFLIPLGCLLLVTLFGVRSVGGFGGWWGFPIALGSGISLTASFLFPPWLFARFMDLSSRAPSYFQPVGLDGFQRVLAAVFQPLRWQSLAGVVVGLGLIGLMVIMDWRRRNAAPANPEHIL